MQDALWQPKTVVNIPSLVYVSFTNHVYYSSQRFLSDLTDITAACYDCSALKF